MRSFFEQMYFNPKWYHYILMVILFPFSILYAAFMLLRRLLTSKKYFSLPIISIGNLIVGGSGKTPFTIALASRYEGVTIVSRGYGRKSNGLVEVSSHGKILSSVEDSGDEAMLMALSLPNASVIVSEDRALSIEVAMREGARLIIMDDGFNRVEINKFEILLEPDCLPNILPFPAGGLREWMFTRRYADTIAIEEKDYTREVTIENQTETMVLVTAISNPERLNKFLPQNVISKVYYEDHAYFNEKVLKNILDENNASSILCTSKDRVKMQGFKLPISEMKLELSIENEILIKIDQYIEEFKNEK